MIGSNSMDNKEYIQFVNDLTDEIIVIRRDLHKYAESMWTEFRTTSIIAEKLERYGFKVTLGKSIHSDTRYNLPDNKTMEERLARAAGEGAEQKYLDKMKGGYTGLIAEIGSGNPIKAIRLDIDAMPFTESHEPDYSCQSNGYSSIHKDGCHSCGHDAHAAILIGIAKVLSHYKDKIKGTVRLIAQPGEEGVAGGISMVNAGAVDNVSSVYGAHMDTSIEAGTIAFTKGGWAASHKLNIKLEGGTAHSGSHPQMGNNCILAGANIIQNLYAMPRHSDGYTRINVGTIQGGTARNSIAPYVYMRAETRAQNQEIADELYERAKKIISNSADMYGCSHNIEIAGLATTAEFSDEDIAYMKRIFMNLDVLNVSSEFDYGKGGCEDFSFYVRKVQENSGRAGHIRIGAKPVNSNQSYVAHSSRFDINEEGMIYGIMALGLLMLS